MAVPLRKQAEQLVNSYYLHKLGYGVYHDELTVEAVGQFCERLDDYAAALSSYEQDGNTRILSALDRLLGSGG